MNDDTLHMSSRKALWFTLVPITATVLLLAAIAFKQHMFAASDRLFAFTDSGVGIVNGMPVKIQGFVIGSVREIVLVQPDDGAPPKVRLTLDVSRDAMRYIGMDSSIRFVQEGLIGQAVLEIVHGTGRARRAANGDVLAFDRGRTFSEIASDLSSKAHPVLDNVQTLTHQLSDPAGDFALTLNGARQVMAQTDETMKALSVRASDTLTASSSLLVRAEKTLPKVDGLLDSTDRLLHHVERTLPKVDGVLDQVRDVAQSANALVGRTQNVVEDGGQIAEDASKITKGVMRSWPFSSWAPKASERMLPIDSQDNAPSFMEPISNKGGK